MRKIIGLILFLSLLIPASAYSLDLDAVKLYPNIIKSLKKQESGWFIHSNNLIFTNPSDVSALKEMSYPGHDIKSIVVLSYNLFHNNIGYVMIEKPLREFVPDKYEKQIIKEIKILTMEKLYNEGVRRRSERIKQKPIEKIEQPMSEKKL